MPQPCAEHLDISKDERHCSRVTHDLCRRSRRYRPYSGSRAEIAAHMAARATGVRIGESPGGV